MKTVILFFLSLIFITSTSAHDYWMSPINYRPQPGETVPVRLFVGDHFSEEVERSLSKKMTVDFKLHPADGKPVDLTESNKFDEMPAAKIKIDYSGSYLLSMQRGWARIEMEGKKFHQYLEHEGLTNIIELREKAGEAETSATERYRRYLKTMIVVGGKNEASWKMQVGHKLEIIPLSNPTSIKPGTQSSFQVLLDGKPLSGVQLAALGRNGEKITDLHTRTDKKGRGTFPFDHPGEWLIKLVHLRRCEDPDDSDWESFWSAFTFSIQAAKP